jgi:hypothetical protein
VTRPAAGANNAQGAARGALTSGGAGSSSSSSKWWRMAG